MKLDGFNIPYAEEHKSFSNIAIFDFESFGVPTDELRATETYTWIEKYVPISISKSSNLQDDPFFLCERSRIPNTCFCFQLGILAEKKATKNYKVTNQNQVSRIQKRCY